MVELCATISIPAFGGAPRGFVIEANTRDGNTSTYVRIMTTQECSIYPHLSFPSVHSCWNGLYCYQQCTVGIQSRRL